MTFIDNPLYTRETHKAKNCEPVTLLGCHYSTWMSLGIALLTVEGFHKWGYHEIIHL